MDEPRPLALVGSLRRGRCRHRVVDGQAPAIWAAELHPYKGRYYYFATFTNDSVIIARNHNGAIPRRASHVLVSDNPAGPYRPVGDGDYCPADRPTLDGTFWVEDGVPYMVFCGEWLINDDGTMEAVRLADDLSARPESPSCYSAPPTRRGATR